MVGLVAELESMPPSGFARVRLRGFEVEVSLGLRLEKRKGFGLVNLGLSGEDEREHRLAERFGAWLSRSISLLKCCCFCCACGYGWFGHAGVSIVFFTWSQGCNIDF